MRKLVIASVLAGFGFVAVAQQPPAPSPQVPDSPLYNIVPPAPPAYNLNEAFLRWPLPPGAAQYATIDGRHIHALVVEQAMISRHYRDQGHPLYWGRPIGSSADGESAEWLAAKFRQIGLADVRVQQLPINEPVWEPVQPWDVTATSGSRVLHLTTAHPPYGAVAAPPAGLDLEAVYVGMGSEAEFAGKDVHGKAVVGKPHRLSAFTSAPSRRAPRRCSLFSDCLEISGRRPILLPAAFPPSRSGWRMGIACVTIFSEAASACGSGSTSRPG
jgi:hypothetical protein